MYFYVLLYYCHRANTQLQLNKKNIYTYGRDGEMQIELFQLKFDIKNSSVLWR
jgi:hypothetical protein